MNTNGIKRFISCVVPVYSCNFRCKYCYLDNHDAKIGGIHEMILSPEKLIKRLSKERLGGICYFNLCGVGETMMHPQLNGLVYELTKEGHYCDIITNGTISKKFDELLLMLSNQQKSKLLVKFSFHYLELKRLSLLSVFASNVEKCKKSGVSYSIEITPEDDLIPHINDVKSYSLQHFGALPHLTVTRTEEEVGIPLMTKYSFDEYKKIWGQFESDMFDFKTQIFRVKRKEFCYAGDWSLLLNLETGIYRQCYKGRKLGNITEQGDIHFCAIGKCLYPHCVNGHAFLTLGTIPEMDCPSYSAMRDRTTDTGKQWLTEPCQKFFSSKLYDNNSEFAERKKKYAYAMTSLYEMAGKVKGKLKK